MDTGRTPQFLVCWEPRLPTWWSSLAACFVRLPEDFSAIPHEITADPWTPGQRPLRAYSCSALLHWGVLFFIVFVPLSSLLGEPRAPQKYPEIVYDLKPFDLSPYLPSLRAKGPGGMPGRGTDPSRPPARGSTAFHPKLTIVSNPPRPDNTRQTIIQPNSPPDVRITQELRLPNVVLGTPVVEPQKPKQFELAGRVARQPSKTIGPASEAPHVNTDLALPPLEATNPFPRLAVALPAPALGSLELSNSKVTGPVGLGSADAAEGGPSGLLILSVDPGPVTGSLALPPGNRYGDFSISPFGGVPGSPGGVPGGVVGGGSGGPGLGGDGISSGVGSGGGGGGGGGAAGNNAGVTISGGSGGGGMMGGSGPGYGAGSSATLTPYVPSSLVYPVRQPIRLRKGALTVSTGPIGGGGLRVYGVLKGGKIYSIYLPMPGKNWILQYCRRPDAPAKGAPNVRDAVAHLESGLVPPNPQERFDFHRPPVPKDKVNDLIILHGVLREDGLVAELRIHQGVDPVADQAALAAFAQWKFQPALRGGKPVALNILVGVPATVPTTKEEPPTPVAGKGVGQ